jgi:hypothetical protein
VDPWDGDPTSPVSLNKYLYGYANPGVYVDPDGRQSITINVTSCAEDGSCVAVPVAGSALPFLSPSQMATPEQAAALAESQARARLFGGGRADVPMVVQPMLASGAGQFERPYVEYGSSRKLSAMQSSSDLYRALGAGPSYVKYGHSIEIAGDVAFRSLPPVAVASGVRTMATAESGWQFAGGALEAALGASPLGVIARAELAAWRAERALVSQTGRETSVIVVEGGGGEVQLVLRYKPHGDRTEFARQLSLQDEGFAEATAGEIRSRIESFRTNGRPSAATTASREARRRSPADAKGRAALHAPDCCIGGDPTKIAGFGGIPENSSIGSQNKKLQRDVYEVVADAPPDARIRVRSELAEESSL